MKKLCILMILAAALLFNDKAMSEQFRVVENLRHEQINLPPSIPDRNRMLVVDYTMFLEGSGTAGILIFYDDGRTKQEVDYIESYDLEGNLLLVSWIDHFGVCQVAMDRGLIDAEEPEIAGTLVLIGGLGREL
jgi:hypothetical protein